MDRVTPAHAAEIVRRHYGVIGTAERLAAEHDDTFRLVATNGTARLLKISVVPDDATSAGGGGGGISLQTAVLAHLAAASPEVPVQRNITTLDGRPEITLEGSPARLALRGFRHPGAGRTHRWDLQNFGRLRPLLDELTATGQSPSVVMGKPMGNGLPIAGIVAKRDVLQDFGATARYFNTFGGNPVCVAAASAVLDVLESEGLQANSLDTGAYLTSAIVRLAAGRPVLADVRGAGLYIGVDVVSPDTGEPSASLASTIVNGMRERRVLISATGPRGHVLKIRPPLPFGRAHADQFLDVLSDVLASCEAPLSAKGPQACPS